MLANSTHATVCTSLILQASRVVGFAAVCSGEGRGIHIILPLRQSNTGADHHHHRAPLVSHWFAGHMDSRSTSAPVRLQALRLCERANCREVNGCRFQCCSSAQSLVLCVGRGGGGCTTSQQSAATPDHLAFKPPRPQTDYVPLRTQLCSRLHVHAWITDLYPSKEKCCTNLKPNPNYIRPSPGSPSQAQLKKALPSQNSPAFLFHPCSSL